MAQRSQLNCSPSYPVHGHCTTLDESSPLLAHPTPNSLESQPSSPPAKVQPTSTPLPKTQLVCLCIIRLVDPITFTQIFPYVNEMMAHLHLTNDPSRVGFYSGLAESAFSICSLFSIYQWARLSGARLPFFLSLERSRILSYIINLYLRRNRTSARDFHWRPRCESCDSALWFTTDSSWYSTRAVHRSVIFGHSPSTFVTSIVTGGFFSGNTAVIFAVLGEMTDSTNQAIAFPIFGLAWPIGSIIGYVLSIDSAILTNEPDSPLIGGASSNPANSFPNLFGHDFFRTYPYFLPGCIASVIALAGAIFGYFFLEEVGSPHSFPTSVLIYHRRLCLANVESR